MNVVFSPFLKNNKPQYSKDTRQWKARVFLKFKLIIMLFFYAYSFIWEEIQSTWHLTAIMKVLESTKTAYNSLSLDSNFYMI